MKPKSISGSARLFVPASLVLLCGLGLGASGTMSGPELATAPVTQDDKPKAEKTKLALAMKKIGGAQRSLRKQLRAMEDEATPEAFDAAMAIARDVQLAVLTAKNEAPKQTAAVPEDKRRAFVAGYKRSMKDFLAAWLDLEIALYERKLDAAQAAFDAMSKLKRPGHMSYKKKRDW